MLLSSLNLTFDDTFYSGCLMIATIISYLIKDIYLKDKYLKIIHLSLCIDRIFVIIIVCVMMYDTSREVSTCEFFHDCYQGENDTLLAESYSYTVKEPECPSSPYPLVYSFSDRHSNGNTETAHVPWAGSAGATICPDSPYDCCYLSTYCDSIMKLGGWHYTSYLHRPSGPQFLHFGSMNTHITQKDENGTNCPQLDDIIIDYLHMKEDESFFYCTFMIVCYLFACITQIYFYKKVIYYHKKGGKTYTDLESGVDDKEDVNIHASA